MCCEVQSECSGRATLAPLGVGGGGGSSVGAPLNSRLRAGPGVGSARDWLEAVKMHRGPREPWEQAAVAAAMAAAAAG